jgi:glucose/mannose-6-phosphate isomerase
MYLQELVKHFPNAELVDYVQDLSIEKIKKIDEDNLYSLLTDYHLHIKTAINNAIAAIDKHQKTKISKIVILGIGGSAMSGELLRAYLKYFNNENKIDIVICRGTEIPDDVSQDTIVFCCSYSGNTFETLQALEKIKELTDKIFVVTSGGKLKDIAEKYDYRILLMSTGMMPRCAVFYSFFHLLYSVLNHDLISINTKSIIEEQVKSLIEDEFADSLNYSSISNQNISIILARMCQNRVPVIYSAAERLEAVNLR